MKDRLVSQNAVFAELDKWIHCFLDEEILSKIKAGICLLAPHTKQSAVRVRVRKKKSYDVWRDYVNSTNRLMLCPFCGEGPIILDTDRKQYWASCLHCHARSGLFETPGAATEAWNRRMNNGDNA